MSTRRKNTKRRTRATNRDAIPASRVRELLLELTYRLHATRPVPASPRPTGSVA